MRTIVLSVALLAASGLASARAATADPTPGDLVLRCHFTGLDALLADTNAAKLKQIWALPATGALRQQACDQLARVPFQVLSNFVAKGAADQAALFRPLLDDVFPSESYLEWRGPTRLPTEFAFAIRLTDERAKLWRENLQQALKAWKFGAITSDGDGWVFQRFDGRTSFAVSRVGQWTVLGLGPAGMKLHSDMLKTIKASGRPVEKSPYWLEADANLAQLKEWLPPLAAYEAPPMAHLCLSNSADYVRTVMRLDFGQKHGWTPEPWAVPTNVIRDPLISFTVAQGIAPLLKPLKFFQQLNLDPQPNQLITWAQPQFPFMSYFAVPLQSAGPQLVRITPLLSSLVLSNGPQSLPGKIDWSTNQQSVVWQGLPIAMPQLAAVKSPQHEYIIGGLFPRASGTNPPPPGLFAQLGRTNLVYYDWEFTGQIPGAPVESRLKQWQTLYQLSDILHGWTLSRTNLPTQQWLQEVSPLLGNTLTEITATSPTEMTLVRNSQSGFTGFELVSFTRWLDSPEFPRFSVAGHPKLARPVKTRPAPKSSKP